MEEFVIETPQFSGPLDVLLSLIEERKLYINELSLSEVTDKYLSYVQGLPGLPLNETSQFILIASTLLLIKSRSLLPSLEISNEEEHDIQELTERLEHYQVIKRATRLLAHSWHGPHLREQVKQPVSPVIIFSPGEATIERLTAIAHTLVRALPVQSFRNEAVVEAVVSLEEVLARFRDRITRVARTQFSHIAAGAPRHEVILHFLALLELVKGGDISAEQSGAFDDIIVESHRVTTPVYGM